MTAAMGMMTAIAIVAALLRPLVEPPFDPDALRAVWVDEEVAEVRVDDVPVPAVGETVKMGCVLVMVVTIGPDDAGLVGVCVRVDVIEVTTVTAEGADVGTTAVDEGVVIVDVDMGTVVVSVDPGIVDVAGNVTVDSDDTIEADCALSVVDPTGAEVVADPTSDVATTCQSANQRVLFSYLLPDDIVADGRQKVYLFRSRSVLDLIAIEQRGGLQLQFGKSS